MLSNTGSSPRLHGGNITLETIRKPTDVGSRRTKIVCTMGPASWSEEGLAQLMDAGMNVARFNFSHGSQEGHLEVLERLRKVATEKCRNIAILLDTKGPEIRTGFFEEGISKLELRKGEHIILTTDYNFKGNTKKLACSYPQLCTSVTPGQQILCADGSLVLTVLSLDLGSNEANCRIENNAVIGERKNMNLPGVIVDLPTFTAKDVSDIVDFAIKYKVDFIAASFVRKAGDVANLRQLLAENGGSSIKIICKIENQEGLHNYDDILQATDSIMVARGDLGMEIPSSKVFLAQKMMIRKANIAGKPVITATQMLESMVTNPRPTRAECSDVANAVYDGTDAVMLSGETANGPHFEAAVKVMARTCCEAEQSRNHDYLYMSVKNSIISTYNRLSVGESIASSAVKTAIDIEAKLIVVFSETGKMASYVAKFRPGAHVMCVTPNPVAARQASGLLYSVHAVVVDSLDDCNALVDELTYELVQTDILKKGDRIVAIAGRMSGMKEQLQVVTLSEGKSHGHILRRSDSGFHFNPALLLKYGTDD